MFWTADYSVMVLQFTFTRIGSVDLMLVFVTLQPSLPPTLISLPIPLPSYLFHPLPLSPAPAHASHTATAQRQSINHVSHISITMNGS